MKKNILFIINPISGTQRKQSMPQEIEQYLDHNLFNHEIIFTTHAGHASELATEAAKNGVDIVVAVGGDGTINEVARSLVHTSTALGIIPCGSGNGLARHLQIPQTPRGAIEILNQDVVHCLDYGKINGRPFFCTCGMGFDAFVSKKFADSGRRGLLQYARNTIGVGLTYQSEHYILEYDGQREELDAFLIACANASQYGNNAYIAPTASMKDGLMDVIVMKPFPTIEGAYVLLQMFTKTLLNNNHVVLSHTKRLHVKRQQPGAVHVDGDPVMMGCDIDVALIPHSFNVVVNPKAHDKKKNYIQEMGERLEELIGKVNGKENADGKNEAEEAGGMQGRNHDAGEFDLQRFVIAQEGVYSRAVEEIRAGKKQSHWMWFVFPQLAGLGRSAMAQKYAIANRYEAEAYLRHPVLGMRLLEITEELLRLDGLSAFDIFGSPDDIKLRSCMTLFSAISEEGNIFEQVLNKYYNGKPCQYTLASIR